MRFLTPHSQVLRLARSGSPGRAWALMTHHGLLNSRDDPRALTLQARLVKDRARTATGIARARLFEDAAAIYLLAAELERASYPLINAASLSLLAGLPGEAERLAREVLALLEANPDEAETPYWLGATRAEALLLLGQEVAARAALRAAVERQPAAWEDHAATISQFELICAELGYETTWLDAIRPPASMQFAGIMRLPQHDPAVQGAIADWLERENIGFGFGALAAGSDIWIAEALLARGGRLNVVLPCDAANFREHSVAAIDPAWLARFDQLLARADEVFCLDHVALPDPGAVALAENVALGMSGHNAGLLRSKARVLRIDDLQDGRERREGVVHIAARRIGAGPKPARDPAPGMQLVLRTRDGERVTDACAAAVRGALAAGGRAAIECLPGGASPDSALADRLAAMLDCAEEGQVLATRHAGFALLAVGATKRIEEAGELRWAGGTVPLVALL